MYVFFKCLHYSILQQTRSVVNAEIDLSQSTPAANHFLLSLSFVTWFYLFPTKKRSELLPLYPPLISQEQFKHFKSG